MPVEIRLIAAERRDPFHQIEKERRDQWDEMTEPSDWMIKQGSVR